MTTLRAVLLSLACATACVEADATPESSTDDRTLSDDGALTDATGEVTVEDDPSICDLLPSCGICSYLCDAEALAAQLPPNTCAAILCTLTNGVEVTAHACNVQ